MSFLSQSDISQLLECEICNLKYDINDIPKIIPCGKTACLKCMCKINENSTYFKCLNVECTEEHSIPRYGFPINKKILDLIAIIKVKRIPVIKPLELSMDYIRSIIIEISNDLDEGNNKIKKYCNELKRQVLVTTEEKIKNLQELSESLVEIINDYENTCIQRYNSSRTTKFKKKMEKILKGANKFIQDRTEYLNQLEINENEVNISIELAKEYKEFLDKQKMNIEGLIFDNKLLEFKINLSRLEETSIGFISSKQFEISALNFDEELKEIFKEKSEKSISCENTIIISGCWDNTIKLWDSKTGECLNTLDSHDGVVFCLQLIDDDKLASGSSDEKIKIWNINTGDCIKTFKGHTSSVICLQVIPDETPNEILVSGSWDKTIKLWNLKEGELLNTLIGHDNGIMSIQVVSKQTLISASSDSKIKIWDLVTGHCLKTLHGHADGVSCIQVIKNAILVSGSNDNHIKIWNLNKKSITTLEGHTNSVFCFEIISDEIIISGSADSTIKCWNILTSECMKTLEGHESIVFCLQVVKDTNIVVSGSYDATVKVWNFLNGCMLFNLEGHSSSIHCIQILSDEMLVSGSADNTIKIWNFKNGDCIKTLEDFLKIGHSHYLSCLKLYNK